MTWAESKVKLVTVVEGDPKAPFSIATTPRCRGGRNSFPWIAPLYFWYVTYIADCISHWTNTIGKGMNPIILPLAMGKIVGQTRFFSLGEATNLGEGKLWIQTC